MRGSILIIVDSVGSRSGRRSCGHAGGSLHAGSVEGRELRGEVDEAVVEEGLHGYEAGTEDPEVHFGVRPPLDRREGVCRRGCQYFRVVVLIQNCFHKGMMTVWIYLGYERVRCEEKALAYNSDPECYTGSTMKGGICWL